MARGGSGLIFFIDLILGLYFLNFGINFITLPETFSSVSKWIIFVGGIFLILGGIKYLTARRYGY
jgi:hypothetical protein